MIEQLTMKEQVAKLLSLEYDLNNFYSIIIREDEMRLIGPATEGLINKLKSLDYEVDFNKEYNWINATKDNINCVLTLNK